MSFIENAVNRFRNKENKPYEPSALENKVLTIAAQWKMDGTPWWNTAGMGIEIGSATRKQVAEVVLMATGKLLSKGMLDTVFGGEPYNVAMPLKEVPPIRPEDDLWPYYQITPAGENSRKPITDSRHTSRSVPSNPIPHTS